MRFIGIDPGLKGGIAILNQQGKVIVLESMPITIQSKYKLFQTFKETDNVYMEKVSSRPTDSRRGAFTFGKHLGELYAILTILGIPFVLVSPKDWQLFFGIKREKGESKYGYKKRILERAKESRRLSNSGMQKINRRGRQINGGDERSKKELTLNTCDAYLIALYAYNQSKTKVSENA